MTIKQRAKITARMTELNDRMHSEETSQKPVMFLTDVKDILQKYIPSDKLNSVMVDIISYGNYQENLSSWIELNRVLDDNK